ncbi:MAG: PAS domain S-box protein, partial [Rhodothermales bacterium]|nr:PAS domain S-box protein [Rhodothermales bacterium]
MVKHEQIPVCVRKEWRSAFSGVPGVKMRDAPPDPESGAPAVVDENLAEEVLASRPGYPIIVALPDRDHERECFWLERGCAACLALTDDLKSRLPRCVERARARRTALNRVRKEDVRYRAMVDNLMEVVTLLDGFGVILHESPSIHDVFGWDPNELVGRNSMEFVHLADVPGLMKLLG